MGAEATDNVAKNLLIKGSMKVCPTVWKKRFNSVWENQCEKFSVSDGVSENGSEGTQTEIETETHRHIEIDTQRETHRERHREGERDTQYTETHG